MIALVSTPGKAPPRAAWLEVILWAGYLACSWTWCIGLFLPVLLVRDYGIMGWVVFAIPNVIGAAAMGWVLREGMSERIVRDHAQAIELFRLVTVVFQLWFLLAYLMPPMGNDAIILPAGGRLAIVGALLAGLVLGLRPGLGVVAWIFSIGCAAFAFSKGDLALPVASPEASGLGLLWLAPVCAFGFALCPYLDPTFHQARQATRGGTALAAFTVGFGVMFLAMIVLTLFYADWARAMASNAGGIAASAAVFIAMHIGLQLSYTCTVHARATPGHGTWSASRIGFAMLLAGAAALATAYLPDHSGLQAREIVYRVFMSFYGLVFPAYVWICMAPLTSGVGGNTAREASGAKSASSSFMGLPRRTLKLLCVTIGMALPFYWMGFIERQELWLAPGLGIVLAGRLLVRGRSAADGTGAADGAT